MKTDKIYNTFNSLSSHSQYLETWNIISISQIIIIWTKLCVIFWQMYIMNDNHTIFLRTRILYAWLYRYAHSILNRIFSTLVILEMMKKSKKKKNYLYFVIQKKTNLANTWIHCVFLLAAIKTESKQRNTTYINISTSIKMVKR